MEEILYEIFNRYQLEEIEIWDIYIKYIVYKFISYNPKFDGSIFIIIYFRRISSTIFPDIFI
jgi:hypothetical protein